MQRARRPRPISRLEFGGGAVAGLVRRGLLEAEIRERPRRPLKARPPGRRGSRPPETDLSPVQADAVERIRRAIAARDARPLVLDGVTGSGKTAIYVESIVAALDAGRPALLLVPRSRWRCRSSTGCGPTSTCGWRSCIRAWARASVPTSGAGSAQGDVDVVVGTRLAVVAPLADVGVIIVDEEHDPAYKSDRTPRLQARDVAIRLARLAGAAVVLGSATPSVETVGLARAGTYDRVVLPSRAWVGSPTSKS